MTVGDCLVEYPDSPFLEIVQEAGIRSAVAEPLNARDIMIGVLYAHSQTPDKFGEEGRQLLSKIEAGRMEVHSTNFDLEPWLDVCLRTVEPPVKSERLRRTNEMEPGLPPLLTGQEGLQQVRAVRPLAITLDILMPQKDGRQILHELKANAVAWDIPVIVLSIIDNKDLGYRLGAFDYLLNPFDREAILAALAHISPQQGGLLVVDGDPQLVGLVRQLLEGEPYEVVTATDGQEALKAIAQKRPDIILLDLLMPEMDGFAVIEHLQQDPQSRQIPVIVLTAKTLTAAVIQKRGLDRDTPIQELRGLLQSYRRPTAKG
jgi:CheY-like chemotaxis protein